jgi:3-phosphoshikimate 1-carboxyvinyltransferase
MFLALGLKIIVQGDTLRIPGRQRIRGGVVDSFYDHRIAMAAAIAGTASEGAIEILNAESAAVSDPFFWSHFL